MTSSRTPRATSSLTPRLVAIEMYAVTAMLSTNRMLARTVIFTSKIFPSMIPRSDSMSKMFASTVRSDPKRRVENQTKPIAP